MSLAERAAPLPDDRGWPRVRRGVRLVRVIWHCLYGVCLAAWLRAASDPHQPRIRRAARAWAAQLLEILHVRVIWRGPAPGSGMFVVSNHVSWLDIPVLLAHGDLYFLSKAEVRDWPVVGRLAQAIGTLFIRRGGGESGRKAEEIAASLQVGRSLCVFPEGTTTAGHTVRRFHSPLFAAPLRAGARVQPVALRYQDGAGVLDDDVPFIGEDAFHSHLWRLLRRAHITVVVTCHAPLPPAPGQTATALAAQAQGVVEHALRRG